MITNEGSFYRMIIIKETTKYNINTSFYYTLYKADDVMFILYYATSLIFEWLYMYMYHVGNT